MRNPRQARRRARAEADGADDIRALSATAPIGASGRRARRRGVSWLASPTQPGIVRGRQKAVILAAGVGSRLAPLTNDRPKALVPVLGKPILFRHLDSLAQAGIADRDVIVVGGYKIDVLRQALAADHPEVTVIENDRFEPWNNFWSLYVAEAAVGGHVYLQIDGDALLDDVILPRMIEASGEALLAVDCREELDDETMKVQLKDDSVQVAAVSKKLAADDCVGEYIGVTKLTAAAAARVFREARGPARPRPDPRVLRARVPPADRPRSGPVRHRRRPRLHGHRDRQRRRSRAGRECCARSRAR